MCRTPQDRFSTPSAPGAPSTASRAIVTGSSGYCAGCRQAGVTAWFAGCWPHAWPSNRELLANRKSAIYNQTGLMESVFRFIAPPGPCGYLPDQTWRLEYEQVAALSPAEYMARMQQGWRRFGE